MATSWTDRAKAVDVTGSGFLSTAGLGFLTDPFLVGASGLWEKRSKPTGAWTNRSKPTDAWNNRAKVVAS